MFFCHFKDWLLQKNRYERIFWILDSCCFWISISIIMPWGSCSNLMSDTTTIVPTLYISGRQCGHWPFAQQCLQQSLFLDVAVCISFDPKKQQAVGTQLASNKHELDHWVLPHPSGSEFFRQSMQPCGSVMFCGICTFGLNHVHTPIHLDDNCIWRQIIFLQPDSSISGSTTLVWPQENLSFLLEVRYTFTSTTAIPAPVGISSRLVSCVISQASRNWQCPKEVSAILHPESLEKGETFCFFWELWF